MDCWIKCRRRARCFFCSPGAPDHKDRNGLKYYRGENGNMPTELGKKWEIDWQGNPPHMLTPDIPVWYRWLKKYGPYILELYYDCLLGGPWLTPEQRKDPLQVMWRFNTAKRADAIAETDTETWIIEVASYPGLRAVGQLQVYRTLWREDPLIDKPDRMLLVCERIDADLAAACGVYGIQVYIA